VSRTLVDDDTEVHEVAAVAPSGSARHMEQRSTVRSREEWGRGLAAAEEEEGNGSWRGRYSG
jgi:hypothetical protein